MGVNKAKVISAVNLKGGVGKTTTIHNLGAGLFWEGKRVLFIDLDVQKNLSLVLRASGDFLSIYEVLSGAPAAEAIQKTLEGDLIRGDLRLEDLQEIPIDTLKNALEGILGNYDYILIDTPPRIDGLIINALIASDEAIIPCNADIFSLQGILTEGELIADIKNKYNPDLKISGVLITNYENRGAINQQARENIERQAARIGAPVYKTVIRKNIAVKKAQAMKTSVLLYEPKSAAAEDYREMMKELKENE